MTHTAWTANPIVFSHGAEASISCAANQAKPVNTMIRPSRFSGRARHEASPQPSSEAPTSSVSTAPGSVGRPGGWCAASHTAPAPASTPAAASTRQLHPHCRGFRRHEITRLAHGPRRDVAQHRDRAIVEDAAASVTRPRSRPARRAWPLDGPASWRRPARAEQRGPGTRSGWHRGW